MGMTIYKVGIIDRINKIINQNIQENSNISETNEQQKSSKQ